MLLLKLVSKPSFKDAFGNVLQDGDTITVIKDLKSRVRPLW